MNEWAQVANFNSIHIWSYDHRSNGMIYYFESRFEVDPSNNTRAQLYTSSRVVWDAVNSKHKKVLLDDDEKTISSPTSARQVWSGKVDKTSHCDDYSLSRLSWRHTDSARINGSDRSRCGVSREFLMTFLSLLIAADRSRLKFLAFFGHSTLGLCSGAAR